MSRRSKRYPKRKKTTRRMTRSEIARQRKTMRRLAVCGIILLLLALLAAILLTHCHSEDFEKQQKDINEIQSVTDLLEPDFDVQLLTPNDYSRPALLIGNINNIVIHYTANPGSTAQDNRDYFEGLKNTHTTHASSHFIIGLDGEIIQCIPTSEMSYTSNDRNNDTISIECCHPDETGQFTDATYHSLVRCCAWLCSKFDLTAWDIIRHYDITGKDCPRWFVQNEDAWNQFREDVDSEMKEAQISYQEFSNKKRTESVLFYCI